MLRAIEAALLASWATLPDTAEDEMIVLDASMPARFVAVTKTLPPVEITFDRSGTVVLAGYVSVSSGPPI
ncbi:hypothetical protein GCM10008965_16790 [Methylorubrum aminovorans]